MKYLLALGGIFLSLSAFSQKSELRNDIIQQRIEFIAQQYESSTIDYTNLIEILTFYFDQPMNLNSATREEIQSLQILSAFQIRNLLNYRVQYGDFTTIYELRSLEGFDIETLQNLVPFVYVGPSKDSDQFNLKKSLKYGQHEIMALWGRTLEEQEGYAESDSTTSPNSRYVGDPNRLFFRYRFQHSNRLSVGFTGEKDPGEPFFTANNPNGFDFYSAHLYATNIGIVKQLAIGDYHAQFGQGLTFWSGFSYRKTADVLNTVRYSRNITPYASRNENNFMRGVATTVKLKDFDLTGFYSRKKIDANLAEGDTLSAEEQTFTSLQTSGLHRTPGEIADKKAINEQIMGFNLDWTGKIAKIGGRVVHSSYEGNFERNPQLYQKFLIDTNQWYNAGIDATILLKNIQFFGEFSMSNNGGWAYLAGALLKLDERLSLVVIQRNFQPDFRSVYSNSFGEKSDNNNERGVYVGMKFDITGRLVFNGYVDNYQFDWLSYQADGPSKGLDYMLRLSWSLSRNVELYTRYRKESQQKNTTGENPIRSLATENRQYWRFHLSYRSSPQLKFNSRVEISQFSNQIAPASSGFLMYQDVNYNWRDAKSTLTGRIALFDGDSYDARIYTYENDVLYYFSVPAFYERGVRLYLIYHHKFSKNLEFWVKLARSRINNETTFGTGTEMINAPHRTDARVQLRFTF